MALINQTRNEKGANHADADTLLVDVNNVWQRAGPYKSEQALWRVRESESKGVVFISTLRGVYAKKSV